MIPIDFFITILSMGCLGIPGRFMTFAPAVAAVVTCPVPCGHREPTNRGGGAAVVQKPGISEFLGSHKRIANPMDVEEPITYQVLQPFSANERPRFVSSSVLFPFPLPFTDPAILMLELIFLLPFES